MEDIDSFVKKEGLSSATDVLPAGISFVDGSITVQSAINGTQDTSPAICVNNLNGFGLGFIFCCLHSVVSFGSGVTMRFASEDKKETTWIKRAGVSVSPTRQPDVFDPKGLLRPPDAQALATAGRVPSPSRSFVRSPSPQRDGARLYS